MTDETFRVLLDQLCEFPHRIKSITFGGIGEPLLHPKLSQMIAQVKKRDIANEINLVTNGIALSEKTSTALIDAGLTNMKISLQGIDAQAYYDTSKCRLDFGHFLENLKFLYQHKGQCMIGIKIADIALYRGKQEEEKRQAEARYKELFGDKCDKLGIERIVPVFSAVDYGKVGISGNKSRYDIKERKVRACSVPFYRINIMQNGCVTLCVMHGLHEEWMNILHATLKEIWDSDARKRKLIKVLQNIQDNEMKECWNCNSRYDFAYSEDNLDPYADEIIQRINNA